VESLLTRLRLVPDARDERGRRHDLVEVLFIALVAMVSGADDAEAMEDFGDANESWFREFLELPHGIPSQDTFLRVFAMLDPNAVQTLFRNWVEGLRTVWEGGHIALDGKTLRRSFNQASGGKAIHMVSAWLADEGLVLGQVKVDGKANEIVAIPELLRVLDVRGVTVSIDAMGCQRAIASQIVEQGGHYVLSVKDNHPTLHAHIDEFFADSGRLQRPVDDPAPTVEVHEEVDAGHGRVETRTCWFSRDLTWVDQREDWRGLDGIAMVLRERHDKRTGTTSREKAYFIVANPTATAGSVARVVRNHWGIENGLHWVLDMTFDEDACRVRAGHAAQNLAVLRHLVMNLMRTAPGKKRSMVKRRQRCAWDRSFMLSVLAGREVTQ
jgi:predicted transposase YbfD/YdcC